MERCDVAIVGGGPAGSSCAWQLVRRGLDVVVLDRARFPRDKVCAGWITPQIVESLALSLEDYGVGRVLQPIRGFRVGMSGATAHAVEHDVPVSYGIRRCELDHYLLMRSGARLRLGRRLRWLARDGAGWLIDGELRARLVIGAGGHFCPVARQLAGDGRAFEPVVAAREIEVELSPHELERYDGELPELYFEPDLAGYGWIVRKGSWLNIGLGRQLGDLNARLRAFLAQLQSDGRLPSRALGALHGHAYLLRGETPRSPSHAGALLIGDALGLADPHSGEGIRAAVESGLLAADAIADTGCDPSPSALACYDERLRARFGKIGSTSASGPRLSGGAVARLRTRFGGWLLDRTSFARHVVVDRWFLHREQPALRVASAAGAAAPWPVALTSRPLR